MLTRYPFKAAFSKSFRLVSLVRNDWLILYHFIIFAEGFTMYKVTITIKPEYVKETNVFNDEGMKILGGSYGFRGNGGGISRCREGVREGLEKIE